MSKPRRKVPPGGIKNPSRDSTDPFPRSSKPPVVPSDNDPFWDEVLRQSIALPVNLTLMAYSRRLEFLEDGGIILVILWVSAVVSLIPILRCRR